MVDRDELQRFQGVKDISVELTHLYNLHFDMEIEVNNGKEYLNATNWIFVEEKTNREISLSELPPHTQKELLIEATKATDEYSSIHCNAIVKRLEDRQ